MSHLFVMLRELLVNEPNPEALVKELRVMLEYYELGYADGESDSYVEQGL